MKISIITVSYNAEDTIEQTLISIKKNKTSDIEYIIIDGNSQDGTKKIINQYLDIVDIYVSEKDNGIYDALNKGIKIATGEWVMLLAADDKLLLGALDKFKESVKPDTEIWCGSIIAQNPYGCFIEESDPDLTKLNYSCTLRNPATLFRKYLFEKYGYFSIKYKCSGDRELFLRMRINGVKFQIENIPIVLFSWGGISTRDLCNYAIPESKEITIKYGIMNKEQANIYYRKLMIKEKTKKYLCKNAVGNLFYQMITFEVIKKTKVRISNPIMGLDNSESQCYDSEINMNNKELKKLHDLLLYIAKEVHRLCLKNDIKYTLFAGTMLGAVRHNGFIPWDDDFDVAMPREDYDRFILACRDQLGAEFRLLSWDTSPNYSYGFSKITLKGTSIEQKGIKNGKNMEIYIDVFPYDNVPDSMILRKIQKWVNYLITKLLEEKYDGIGLYASSLKKICFPIFHILNFIISSEWLKTRLFLNMIKYNKLKTKFISCICGYYGYDCEIMPQELFDSLNIYTFENLSFYGITNYHLYLSKIYGDYMQLPPVEKRHTHDLIIHSFGRFE